MVEACHIKDKEILENIELADPAGCQARHRAKHGGDPFPAAADDRKQEKDRKEIDRKDHFTHDQGFAVITRHHLFRRRGFLPQEFRKIAHCSSGMRLFFFLSSTTYFA